MADTPLRQLTVTLILTLTESLTLSLTLIQTLPTLRLNLISFARNAPITTGNENTADDVKNVIVVHCLER